MSKLPQSSKAIVVITTSIFIVVILLTMRRETGNIEIGYPWSFYSYSGTDGESQTSMSSHIQPVFFILEWLMIAAVIILMKEGFKKVRQ